MQVTDRISCSILMLLLGIFMSLCVIYIWHICAIILWLDHLLSHYKRLEVDKDPPFQAVSVWLFGPAPGFDCQLSHQSKWTALTGQTMESRCENTLSEHWWCAFTHREYTTAATALFGGGQLQLFCQGPSTRFWSHFDIVAKLCNYDSIWHTLAPTVFFPHGLTF